jgi:hypothetical protein
LTTAFAVCVRTGLWLQIYYIYNWMNARGMPFAVWKEEEGITIC